MKRTVKYIFRSPVVVTDITGNTPRCLKHRLPYAKAERIDLMEGTIVSQYYNHFLFFIEVIEIDVHHGLQADYLLEDTCLFLFMMLEGEIIFETADGEPIAETTSGTCYATYNRTGEFSFRLPTGRHRFCYLIPRNEWVTKNPHYPIFEPFLDQMAKEEALFGQMPFCRIEKEMELSLDKLLRRIEINGKDLEAVLLRDAKRVLYQYQLGVQKKMSTRPYLIKAHVDQNYTNPDLTNKSLMDKFYITEKTLIDTFKGEFGETPYRYIINFRMREAKRLLEIEKKTPSEVSILVGYDNFRSFRTQFVKTFGFPPSGCR